MNPSNVIHKTLDTEKHHTDIEAVQSYSIIVLFRTIVSNFYLTVFQRVLTMGRDRLLYLLRRQLSNFDKNQNKQEYKMQLWID